MGAERLECYSTSSCRRISCPDVFSATRPSSVPVGYRKQLTRLTESMGVTPCASALYNRRAGDRQNS